MRNERLKLVVTAPKIALRYRERRPSEGFVLSLSPGTIREVLRLNRHVFDAARIDAAWLRDRIQEWASTFEGEPHVHLDEVRRALAQVRREPIRIDNLREHARLVDER